MTEITTEAVYAAAVVSVLRKHIPGLSAEASHLAFDAITRQAADPQASFEFIVDDPYSARWRLKARSGDRRRVRLAYYPVMMPGSDAMRDLERTVNDALEALES